MHGHQMSNINMSSPPPTVAEIPQMSPNKNGLPTSVCRCGVGKGKAPTPKAVCGAGAGVVGVGGKGER